jgi:hypothetical protein
MCKDLRISFTFERETSAFGRGNGHQTITVEENCYLFTEAEYSNLASRAIEMSEAVNQCASGFYKLFMKQLKSKETGRVNLNVIGWTTQNHHTVASEFRFGLYASWNALERLYYQNNSEQREYLPDDGYFATASSIETLKEGLKYYIATWLNNYMNSK